MGRPHWQGRARCARSATDVDTTPLSLPGKKPLYAPGKAVTSKDVIALFQPR